MSYNCMNYPSAMPIEDCPKCGLADRVRPKLVTHNLWAEDWPWSTHLCSHYIAYEQKFLSSSHFVSRDTLSALFCDRCSVGFIPDSRAPELGLKRPDWR